MVPDFRILFLLFLIYSAVGWLCESVYCSVPAHKFINRGFLNGPLCPIYGVGALLADALLTPVAWSLPLLFLGGAIVTSVLEYFTGWLLETLFHAKWWDYSNKKWNLHGRVCLRNSVLFGLMCVILLRVLHPLLLGLVLEYLCCRLPRRRIWRAIPPVLGILLTALVGVGRWSLWESETVSPVTQLLIFPGVPGAALLLGCWLGFCRFI